MLIQQYSFCQKTYPEKIIIDGDTVCIVSLAQVDSLNSVYVDKARFKAFKDSLVLQVDSIKKLRREQKKLVLEYAREVSIQENIISEKDSIIDNDKNGLKDAIKKTKWIKVQRNILFLVTVALSIKILLSH